MPALQPFIGGTRRVRLDSQLRHDISRHLILLGKAKQPVDGRPVAGGNARIGLEDNLWLDKGVLATNAQLVERAVTIVENMGARVIGPEEVRKKLNLQKRAPVAA
jgi:uncharacterized protein (DUF849 family)